ncbi:MAG TPA: sigma 54-interacting transcriptional regulator [Terriglobales bacterium]|nr:sigma 54-interacting transcriptional regulator [Terriglobales bacterium]
MSNGIVSEFQVKLEQAITFPFNLILQGEQGVGKEYFARLIHEKRFWAKDFVTLDWECGHSYQLKVVDELVKNHLTGMFNLSSKERNTYFFRRIDAVDWHMQEMIFDLLESEATKKGLLKSQLHQLGIIASLEQKKGNREEISTPTLNSLLDFFPLRMKIPALRQRKEDLIPLMRTILESVNRQQNRKVSGFSVDTFHFFLDHDWPNNIDELRSEIERTATLTKDYDLIRPEVLSEKLIRSHKVLRPNSCMS